jgi:hypothetical protein
MTDYIDGLKHSTDLHILFQLSQARPGYQLRQARVLPLLWSGDRFAGCAS